MLGDHGKQLCQLRMSEKDEMMRMQLDTTYWWERGEKVKRKRRDGAWEVRRLCVKDKGFSKARWEEALHVGVVATFCFTSSSNRFLFFSMSTMIEQGRHLSSQISGSEPATCQLGCVDLGNHMLRTQVGFKNMTGDGKGITDVYFISCSSYYILLIDLKFHSCVRAL